MEPTLKREIDGAEFKETRRGGYDRGEVDDFLDRIAAKAARLETQLGQATERARAAETRLTSLESDLEAEVEHRLGSRGGAPNEEEAADQLKRTLVLAQRTADAAIKESRDEAARLVSEAEAKSRALAADAEAEAVRVRDQTTGEARRQRAEAREGLVAEIQELEGTREQLRIDVTALRQYVEDQRVQLKSSVSRLQQMIEDPALGMPPAPPVSDVKMPEDDEVVAPAAEERSTPEPPTPPPSVGETTTATDVEAEVADDVPAATPKPPTPEPAVRPTPARPPSVTIDAPRVDAPRVSDPAVGFDEVDHEAPGRATRGAASGPPTKPVDAVELGLADSGQDPFLAELRKAIDDDEPLGPRQSPDTPGLFDQDDSAKSRRFGRRGR